MKKGSIPLECGTSLKTRGVCDYVRNADNSRDMPGNQAIWYLGEVRRCVSGSTMIRKFQMEAKDGYLLTSE